MKKNKNKIIKQKENKSKIYNMNKKNLALIIIIIIILSIFAYIYLNNYLTKKQRLENIFQYKKSVYEAALCQYKCPLTLQELNNQTQLLPEKTCLIDCSKLIDKKFKEFNFTISEINNDNLINEMEIAARKCRTENLDASTKKINTSGFFSCTSNNFEKLREKYVYLK